MPGAVEPIVPEPDVPGTRPCRVDAAFVVTCYLYNYSETPALAARSRLLIMRPKKRCLELSSPNQWWSFERRKVPDTFFWAKRRTALERPLLW